KTGDDVVRIARHRRTVRPSDTVQMRQKTPGGFITFRDRFAGRRTHALRSKIFENEKTGIKIRGTHLRHTKALPRKKPVNGSKGKNVFRQMRNLPIGFAVA